jgi:Putative addiction module component
MRRSTPEVLEVALDLAETDPGKPSDDLAEEVEGDLDRDAGSAWVTEIERRLARIEAGQASALSMEEAVARMYRAACRR